MVAASPTAVGTVNRSFHSKRATSTAKLTLTAPSRGMAIAPHHGSVCRRAGCPAPALHDLWFCAACAERYERWRASRNRFEIALRRRCAHTPGLEFDAVIDLLVGDLMPEPFVGPVSGGQDVSQRGAEPAMNTR
jgi:hypothetical protein